MNPIATTPGLLQNMKSAGFNALVSTAESASDTVLKNLNKGYTRNHLLKVARHAKATNLPNLWIFLLGGPGETQETVQETLDFIAQHTGPKDVFYITCGIRIYPHTEIEQRALREGHIQSSKELLAPVFYFSPDLDRNWLRKTLIQASRKDPRIITSERSQSAVVPWGLRALSVLGVRKPFWRFAPMLNRSLGWIA